MKKIFVALLFIIYFDYVSLKCYLDDETVSKKVCTSRTLDEDEKKDEDNTYDVCCYVESTDGKYCDYFLKKNVADQVKEIKKKDSKFSIDCASSYINLIKFGLVYLLLFLN